MIQEKFENNIMKKILDYNSELFLLLQNQHSMASVLKREFTGCGFFTHFLIPDNLKIDNINGDIHDVFATFKNSSEIYGFRLTITNGFIDTLEGFSISGKWEYNYDEAVLEFGSDDVRDYEII